MKETRVSNRVYRLLDGRELVQVLSRRAALQAREPSHGTAVVVASAANRIDRWLTATGRVG